MKSAFSFNGKHYISPSRRQAIEFLRLYGEPFQMVYRFRTGWRIRHIERVPSYCQMMRVGYDKVEFSNI